MNLALTLVIQGVVFFLVAWAVMKFFWPWLMGAIAERQKKIADGLAAASKGEKELGEAETRSKEIIRDARDRAAQIVDLAGKRSNEIVEEAKGTASSEAQRLVEQAHGEVARESTRAREALRQEVGRLAVEGAARLLGREIDAKAHADLLDKLAAEVANG
ncbi:MAG TPA: F0F1 ATP synthase subunit B [Steroidobacteraceae bacterium]|nr:F0F1 ATP synthase subunit B [Steroidobacteraceae bacterium]